MHPYFPAQSRNGLEVVYTVTPDGKEKGYSDIPPISDTKWKITGEDESRRGRAGSSGQLSHSYISVQSDISPM